jgi:hypothetical protein
MKKCQNCIHWSRHICVDNKGEPIKRESTLSEPFWYYEECKKNWGLPKSAHTTAEKCQFFNQIKSLGK